MFCVKCGSEIPDFAKFCPKCGAHVEGISVKPEETPETLKPEEIPEASKPEETSEGSQEKPHTKRKRRILITLIIIAAVVAVMLILFFGFDIAGRTASGTTVDLDDYITVEFDGYDGNGTADVTFDIDALGDDYDGEIRLSKEAEELYDSFSDVVEDNAYPVIEPDTGLSVGDEVTVKWEVDSESIESLIRGKVELLDEEIDYTIIDFEEADEAPADETGKFPEEMSGDHTAEGTDYAVTSLDQIPDEAMDGMKEKARQTKTEEADSWDPERFAMDSMEYVGSYLLSKKPGSDADDLNKIYLVYKLHVIMYGKNADGSDSNVEFDCYWYGGFRNGIVKTDGTFDIDYEDISRPVYSPDSENTEGIIVTAYDYTKADPDEQENTEVFEGYENISSMFDSLIVPMEDDYTCESTVLE